MAVEKSKPSNFNVVYPGISCGRPLRLGGPGLDKLGRPGRLGGIGKLSKPGWQAIIKLLNIPSFTGFLGLEKVY